MWQHNNSGCSLLTNKVVLSKTIENSRLLKVKIHCLRTASRGFEPQKSQWWWQGGHPALIHSRLQQGLAVNQEADSFTLYR